MVNCSSFSSIGSAFHKHYLFYVEDYIFENVPVIKKYQELPHMLLTQQAVLTGMYKINQLYICSQILVIPL